MLFGIHPATAVGTDLFFAAATKSVGTLVHGLSRTVRWGIVGRLACGSVPATGLTLLVLSRFDVKGAALDQLTTQILACSLLLTAAALIFRQQTLDLYAARVGELGPRATTALTVTQRPQPSVARSACCPACLAWSAGSQRSCRPPAAAAQQSPSGYEAERLSLERTGLWTASSLGHGAAPSCCLLRWRCGSSITHGRRMRKPAADLGVHVVRSGDIETE